MNLLARIKKWSGTKTKNRRLVNKYLFHKKAFSIADSEDLSLFENFLLSKNLMVDRNEHLALECSCKISSTTIFPGRFYLSQMIPRANKREKINRLLGFFHEYSAKQNVVLDQSRLEKMIREFEFFNITRFGFALDIREKEADSRIKLGAFIDGNLQQIKRFAEEYRGCGLCETVKDSIISSSLCCVYDFFGDGRSSLKIYPVYHGKDVEYLLAKNVIPHHPRIKELISGCNAFHIGFRDTLAQKLYHFWHPVSEEKFVESLGHKVISEVYAKITGCQYRYRLTISLSEEEILSGKIVNANIYY